ncbi:MAG: LAGLIDADG family homing endonuclease [Candidatus Micrarchaeota archaeon]|nr:LAGLIDADG family homing endonuclease [Candidatus Micrarchaeota archaeon]
MTDEGEKQATKFYINGFAETRKIKTAAGYEIQGTLKHKIKVFDLEGNLVWKSFADIQKGDSVPLTMNTIFGESKSVILPPLSEMHWTADFETKVPKEMSAEFAEILGYFMGDGSLHAKGLRFCVTNGDDDVTERLKELTKSLFNLDCHLTQQKGYIEVAVNSVPLAVWWEAAGFAKIKPEEHIGGKGYQPHIPDAVLYTNNKEIYSAFLRGLFEADGTVSVGNPSWTTASIEFSGEVRTMLLSLGYPTTTKIDISGWGQSEIYVLRIRNSSYNTQFIEQIGFMSNRKKSQIVISETYQGGKKDRIPLSSEVAQEIISSAGNQRGAVMLSLRRHNSVSRNLVKSIYEQTKSPKLLEVLQFFYDSVASNEDGGVEPTYDLSVPENTTYIANGFISHNTIGLVMDCDTTGIEPDFAIVKFKKLAGGGYFKIVNQSVKKALKKLGYEEHQVKEIEEYCRGHGTLVGCPYINAETLRAKGFTDDKIKVVESQLANAFDVKFVFNKFTLGEEFCTKILGFSKEVLNNTSFDLLSALGFTAEQINKANDYVSGTMTIEGAPYLKEQHYPIFDCANKCGKYGKRYIPHMAHVKMMGAVQPFISGGISKTINMTNEATLEDVKEVYEQSYNLMVKCMALYRDGSKLSQPLNSQAQDEHELLSLVGSDDVDETIGPKEMHDVLVRGMRKKLPPKRAGFVQEARIGGQKLFIRTGEYPDGELGEVFIDSYKEGAGYRSLLNCFAIAVSKGIQYGVPLEEFVDTFTFTRFEPSGVVSGHPNVKQATSLVDFVFRVLGYEYLGRSDLVHVPDDNGSNGKAEPPTLKPTLPVKPEVKLPTALVRQKSKSDSGDSDLEKKADAKLQGFTGEQCGNCGGMRVKNNGSCTVCVDCGQTTGCS